MFENKYKTPVSEFGEFGLIDHLTSKVKTQQPGLVKGVGDDAAVWEKEPGKYTVLTTDTLIEQVHFDLSYVPLKHLGYKAIAVNVSDVCAMNATPKYVTVSLAVSSRFTVEALEELYEGILLACKAYEVDLVGGDTTSSVSGMCLSITAVGEVDKEKVSFRSGGQENDLLVVTGDLGGAYLGLQILEREKQIFLENPGIQPNLEGNDYLLERQLKPEARVDIVKLLAELEVVPTSMIDISDGLASEILHLCTSSKKGCRLFEEKIPLDPGVTQTAEEFNLDPSVCALSGGEDYELLFTIKQGDFDKVKGNPNLTVIGHLTAENDGTSMVTRSGQLVTLTAQGWDAFLKRKENPDNHS